MRKSLLANFWVILLLVGWALPSAATPAEPVVIRFSEAYELSNIILALTP